MHVSLEGGILVAEQFLQDLFKKYGKYPLHWWRAWYPQRCGFLKPHHHAHSYYEKSITGKTLHYTKDRTGSFDDYFPCQR